VIQLIFTGNPKKVNPPHELLGQWNLFGATFPHLRVFIVIFVALCILFVYLWFYGTGLGLKIRSVTQNRPMAAAIGISTSQVDALTFAFGTGLAGVAGCILGAMYGNVQPNMGGDFIVLAFMVVILGGMGQLSGVIFGGLVVGVARGIFEKFYANALISIFPKF